MKHMWAFGVAGALVLSAGAETTVKISGVHLCCGKCSTTAETAVTAAGASAETDEDAGTVAIKAADDATAQKAADALVAAGFFGASDNAAVKVGNANGAKDEKTASLKIKGVHLCCDKCVKGVTAALKNVIGVTGNTAVKKAESFEVTGDFNARDVMSALEKAGYSGRVAH